MHYLGEYDHQPCMHFNELSDLEMIKLGGDKPMADIDSYATGPWDNYDEPAYRPMMVSR